MGIVPIPPIPLYVHWVGITLEIGRRFCKRRHLEKLPGENTETLIHLTMEFIFTPIPISVRQCRQFSHGSPAGTGNITFPEDKLVSNKK